MGFKSFYWSLGTTSFRTKNFNKRVEQQLSLLREFWSLPDNAEKNWSDDTLQAEYYDFLHTRNFLVGSAGNKPKDARQKTSGLVDIGLIDDNRRLTNAGNALLSISEQNNFTSDNIFGLPADSFIYFRQLLKASVKTVRPFVLTAFLLSKFGSLTQNEFTYLLPLAVDKESTLDITDKIASLRKGEIGIDEIIFERLMKMSNYTSALKYLLDAEEVTEDVIAEIAFNRKSRQYSIVYHALYHALYDFYVMKNDGALNSVKAAVKKLKTPKSFWRKLLFGEENLRGDELLSYMRRKSFDSESDLRRRFFVCLHVFKAKATLSDYFDLNRRYMQTSDAILFGDGIIIFDTIPKHYFASIGDKLLDLAFEPSAVLSENSSLSEISLILTPNEAAIINGVNAEFSLNLSSLKEADDLLEKQRYIRFAHLIDTKFTDERLIVILNLIADRADSKVQEMVTDNADIPTIFEYVLAVAWYKISDRQGKILDYMKLSLDADLLPKTHAAGGEADIVYEYPSCAVYPAHTLLLEATLSDGSNQRRMEMEPVSRHLGNHILRTGNFNSYCVFVTNALNINVISDFRSRKNIPYYDVNDVSKFITGMKIIPLEIEDLKTILIKHINYRELYGLFEQAFQSPLPPHMWHETCIENELKGN